MLTAEQVRADIEAMELDLEKAIDKYIDGIGKPPTTDWLMYQYVAESLPPMIGTLKRILEGRRYHDKSE